MFDSADAALCLLPRSQYVYFSRDEEREEELRITALQRECKQTFGHEMNGI